MRALLAQLAEGGRLAAIVAREGNIGRATLLRNCDLSPHAIRRGGSDLSGVPRRGGIRLLTLSSARFYG